MKSDKSVRICVPLCATTVETLRAMVTEAASISDMVELRVDCLAPSELAQLKLDDFLKTVDQSVIVTLRTAEQGGQRMLTASERMGFWRTRSEEGGSELLDIEFDLAEKLAASGLANNWSRIICSHHDFNAASANVEQIYSEMAQTPAGILKIAVQARDVVDCLPLFRLLDRAGVEGRELIPIAMGNPGIATRILGPSRGAFLTYGALQADAATAPGQLTAQQLRSIYRLQNINSETEIFGLVGLPVMHSVSPPIHNAAFELMKLNGVYIPFEVTDLTAFIKRMVNPVSREIDWRLRGLSVTAPHKLAVMNLLDWVDPLAKEIGAVNTVVIEADKLLGYNTDARGLIEPLVECVGPLRDLRVAVLGTGGAASAAVWALRHEQAQVRLFARSPDKAKPLCERFGVPWTELESASLHAYDVVINATPLGSKGELQDKTPVTAEQLQGASFVYDLVYNPPETLLLREARKAGCKTIRGLQMLVAQAALQFQLWTGIGAPVDAMSAAASAALQEN